jgi:hypothetical protein
MTTPSATVMKANSVPVLLEIGQHSYRQDARKRVSRQGR